MGMYELEEAGFDLMKEFCPFEEKEVDQWETLCEENFPEYKKRVTALLGGAAKELFYVPKKGRRKKHIKQYMPEYVSEKEKRERIQTAKKNRVESETRKGTQYWRYGLPSASMIDLYDVKHLEKITHREPTPVKPWKVKTGQVRRDLEKEKSMFSDDQNLTREQAFNYGQQCADLWESKEKFLSAKEEEENRKFFLDWDWALAQEKAQEAFAEYQHLQEIANQLKGKWLYCNDNIAAIEKAIQSIDSYLEGR